MARYVVIRPASIDRRYWVEDDSEVSEAEHIDRPTIEVVERFGGAVATGILDPDGNEIGRIEGIPLGFDLRRTR